MTTQHEDTPGLSDLDVAALRTAERVTFHYHGGRSYIRAGLDTPYEPKVYSAREQRVFPETRDAGASERARIIECGVDLRGYTYEEDSELWYGDPDERAACYASIAAPRRSRTWRTVVDLLRVGDRLALLWVADNNTTVIREADLHADSMNLLVKRGQTRTLEFALDYRITPDNTARMIRRFG